MAVTAETRTGIIALSVAMLGEAPGTSRLGDWVDAVDDGMSLEDLANHIAASDAFQAIYPNFTTNQEFAQDFLGNVMSSEDVPAALVAAAVDIVVGLLNDGMTRGALALAVVHALLDINTQGMDHPAYGDLGMVAGSLANKIAVAEHYTLNARMADPSSSVLEDVTSDDATVMTAIEAIDSATVVGPQGEDYILTKGRDNIQAGEADDSFLADADEDGFATLNGFDTIDGGAGHDIMAVYDISTDLTEGDAEYDAQVSNVEQLEIYARGGIMADVSNWEGLEHVELARFDRAGNVSLTVDGATVSASRTIGGDVTITGAAGEVDLTAGMTSAVQVNSGAHTTSVLVKGGASVNVNSAASASETVTSVSVDGVQRNNGADGARGDNVAVETVTIADGNGAGSNATTYITVAEDGTKTDVDETAADFEQNYYKAAVQDANGDTEGNGLDADEVIVTQDKTMAEGYVADGADMPSVQIHSEAIESVSLSSNEAIVLVSNGSDDPEDLSVTVSGFGSHTRTAGPAKLCLDGDGAAENVSIMVAGDSDFYLAGDVIKNVSVAGDGDVELRVTMFDTSMASGMESLTLSGSGDVEIDVAGMGDLEMIDARASSGGNKITGVGSSVERVSGGSGSDAVTVTGFASGGVAVDLGAGNDTFTAGAASNNKSTVDGGEGMDVLRLTVDDGSYRPTGALADVTIYSNFETLDIGGSAEADYDVKLLGVDYVRVTGASTTGTVTLSNMGDNMGIGVYGSGASGVSAMVIHNMPEREVGDARYSGELDVSLTANGGRTDTKTSTGTTGEATLTIQVDPEIEVLSIASNANPGGSSPTVSARNKPSAGHYDNSLILTGATGATADDATVEAINVSGNAQVEITFAELAVSSIELVDAEDNTAGVTVNVTGATETDGVEMLGGSGADHFTGSAQGDDIRGNGGNDTLIGGDGNDTIRGGAGADTMSGGTGDDVYDYTSVSESQVAWTATGVMHGFDYITSWDSGDTISLGRTLFNSLTGAIKTYIGDDAINATDTNDPDTTDNSLRAFLGDGDGIFETVTPNSDGFGSTTTKHSIATVTESYYRAPNALAGESANVDTDGDGENDSVSDERIWVLIDVDGDGDFDAATDMAIAIDGTTALELADFTM